MFGTIYSYWGFHITMFQVTASTVVTYAVFCSISPTLICAGLNKLHIQTQHSVSFTKREEKTSVTDYDDGVQWSSTYHFVCAGVGPTTLHLCLAVKKDYTQFGQTLL